MGRLLSQPQTFDSRPTLDVIVIGDEDYKVFEVRYIRDVMMQNGSGILTPLVL